eukprot:c37840_g1_i1 orf=76-249(+)
MEKQQETIYSLSRTEGEYKGATMTTCQVAWLHKLLANLGFPMEHKVVIYNGNLSIIK